MSCLRSCKEHEVESRLEENTVPDLKVDLQISMNTNQFNSSSYRVKGPVGSCHSKNPASLERENTGA